VNDRVEIETAMETSLAWTVRLRDSISKRTETRIKARIPDLDSISQDHLLSFFFPYYSCQDQAPGSLLMI
jgi:hypothetical protein